MKKIVKGVFTGLITYMAISVVFLILKMKEKQFSMDTLGSFLTYSFLFFGIPTILASMGITFLMSEISEKSAKATKNILIKAIMFGFVIGVFSLLLIFLFSLGIFQIWSVMEKGWMPFIALLTAVILVFVTLGIIIFLSNRGKN